ncbi:MAG: cupin domain-containing protein [Mesorhizobium sp.]|nr:MAG: cupin domain-containing protein [Mesorhizobium sp.]
MWLDTSYLPPIIPVEYRLAVDGRTVALRLKRTRKEEIMTILASTTLGQKIDQASTGGLGRREVLGKGLGGAEVRLACQKARRGVAAMRVPIVVVLLGCMVSVAGGQQQFNATPVLETSTTHGGQKIAYPTTKNAKITSLLVELGPGQETGRHKETVPTYVYVLEGKLVIEIEGGGTHEYQAGQAFVEDLDTWHNAKNAGQTPMRLLAVFLGEEGKPNSLFPK